MSESVWFWCIFFFILPLIRMSVLQVQAAQVQAASQAVGYQQGNAPPPYSSAPVYAGSALYPSLTEYMGLEITQEMINQHALVPASSRQVCSLFLPQLSNMPIWAVGTGVAISPGLFVELYFATM